MFGINWKFAPTLKINLPVGEPLAMAPNVSVTLPDGFQIDDDGGRRRISWRWFSWQALGVLAFVALWDGLLALWLYAVFSAGVPLFVLVAGLMMGAIGTGMTYAVVACLVNRTSIRVDAAEVSVRHGPLPWPGERNVRKADIDSVCSEKHERSDDTLWDPGMSYAVKLVLKGGRTLKLVVGLRAPEQALFVEQQIRET